MRMFCWNCVFVNVLCVIFLGSRALADSLLPPVDVCLYDEYGDPDALQDRPPLWCRTGPGQSLRIHAEFSPFQRLHV